RLLPTFDPNLSAAAQKKLEDMGVQIRLSERVRDITANEVITDKGTIATSAVLWAAGVRATPAAGWLGIQADSRGRVPVNEFLNVDDDPHIFAIGDVAGAKDIRTGKDLPGVAPV